MGILYIIATPIGNLEDITLRALRILKEVDLILCEDTRITKRLLERHDIKTPTLSYHQRSELKKVDYIISLLKSGKNLALVSDAGTPSISDPGSKLVSEAIKQYDDLKIVPIPGPSAVIAAASISGFPMDKFIFMGFPPHKKKRKKFFEKAANAEYPVIFYESPHRILKSLRDLHETDTKLNTKLTRNQTVCHSERSEESQFLNYEQDSPPVAQNDIKNKQIVVARELTKKFETIYRGNIDEVIKQIEQDKIKGEFVVIVG